MEEAEWVNMSAVKSQNFDEKLQPRSPAPGPSRVAQRISPVKVPLPSRGRDCRSTILTYPVFPLIRAHALTTCG
jgi:hypothetical protein